MGRMFQARGPATEKAISPNDIQVLGTSRVRVSADRNDGSSLPVERILRIALKHDAATRRLDGQHQMNSVGLSYWAKDIKFFCLV